MPEILSHNFMLALDASRDHLYSLALASEGTSAKAEATLQKSVRALFTAYATDTTLDPRAMLEQQLDVGRPDVTPASMPADVWARLSAAVQLEAAKSAHSTALNPDSVLLSPDPLLAPKRASILDDGEAFDLSPPSRFMLASAIAVVIGTVLTIYILTRPSAPPVVPPQPTTPPTTTTRAGVS